ncbi:hypothetical protein U0070_016933 [Myodes glareolus]|uniref:Anthrax toxin receptor C-terminal domain-containing protein n=1 Tax=Myodes glareolus TaxID=447135 RepID=A0AAW0I1N0_MYOGA
MEGKLDALWVLLRKGYDRVSVMRPQPGDTQYQNNCSCTTTAIVSCADKSDANFFNPGCYQTL